MIKLKKGCVIPGCNCSYYSDRSVMDIDCSSRNIRNLDLTIYNLNLTNVINTLSFNLSNNDFYEINSEMFKKFARLNQLILSYNQINDLEIDSFYELSLLKVLRIDNNKLTSLNSLIFDGGVANISEYLHLKILIWLNSLI